MMDEWLRDPFTPPPDDPASAAPSARYGARGQARAAELFDATIGLESIRPAPGARYLVKGWLSRSATSVVYGPSNVGKTFFALDLAMHVAAGTDWHGARIDMGGGGGAVHYVAAEGDAGLRDRIEALRRARRELIQAAEGRGMFNLLPQSLDICLGGDAEALIEALGNYPSFPDLIVFDTLARSIGGADENSGQDMGRLVRNVDLIRAETGAHVMLIHHSGKEAGRGARGHSSLRAAVDTEIELTRTGATVMAETRKQRDLPEMRTFAYRLAPVVIGQDEDGDDVTSAVVEPCEPVQRRPKLSGQARIALQAMDDALAEAGEVKTGPLFPPGRRCVSLAVWRSYCDRRDMSGGEGESSRRTAFHKAKAKLQNDGWVCVQDGFAWRVER